MLLAAQSLQQISRKPPLINQVEKEQKQMLTKTANPTGQLTPRQIELLRAISNFQASNCYSPTIAELASQFGISRSTAFEHITELRKKGLLSSSPAKARSLTITSKAQKLLDHLECPNEHTHSQQAAGIKLLGRVAAGSPIEAIENTEQLSLNSYFGNRDDTFALEVKGDSMIDDGICDGDIVICRRRRVADNGQLVVAIVDEENATLKRFYKQDSAVRLQPANKDYQPIFSDNCRIDALVVGLIRKF